MYEKDFENWNNLKKLVNSKPSRPIFKERDVWWCSLGVNIGDEEDGKGEKFMRPVLVLKKFNKRNFVGVPLSTQIKNNPIYHIIDFKGKQQSVIISQLKLIDAKRITVRIGSLPSNDFNELKEKMKSLIF